MKNKNICQHPGFGYSFLTGAGKIDMLAENYFVVPVAWTGV